MTAQRLVGALGGLVPVRDVIASATGLRVVLSHIDAYHDAQGAGCDLVVEFRAVRPPSMSEEAWLRLANTVHQGAGPPPPPTVRMRGTAPPSVEPARGAGPLLRIGTDSTQPPLVPDAHSPRVKLSYGDPAWVWAQLRFWLSPVPDAELRLDFEWNAVEVRQHDVTISGANIRDAAGRARDLFDWAATSDDPE